MKFLFMSNEGKSADAALRLKREGHEVVYWIRKQQFKNVFDGLLHKVEHWGQFLDNERIVVFDSVGGGKTADRLRRQGFRVWGATEEGDVGTVDPLKCGVEIPNNVEIDYRSFLCGELVFTKGNKVDVDFIGGRTYLTVCGVTKEVEWEEELGKRERPASLTYLVSEKGKKAVGYTANLPVGIAAIQRLGGSLAGTFGEDKELEKSTMYACRLGIHATKPNLEDLNFPSDLRDFYHFVNIAVVDGKICMVGPSRKLVDLVSVKEKWEEAADEVEKVAHELPFKEKMWKAINRKEVEESLKVIS